MGKMKSLIMSDAVHLRPLIDAYEEYEQGTYDNVSLAGSTSTPSDEWWFLSYKEEHVYCLHHNKMSGDVFCSYIYSQIKSLSYVEIELFKHVWSLYNTL